MISHEFLKIAFLPAVPMTRFVLLAELNGLMRCSKCPRCKPYDDTSLQVQN